MHESRRHILKIFWIPWLKDATKLGNLAEKIFESATYTEIDAFAQAYDQFGLRHRTAKPFKGAGGRVDSDESESEKIMRLLDASGW